MVSGTGPVLRRLQLSSFALTAPIPSLQDAPETIEKTLRNEQDLSTRRNAFVMLSNYAQDRAVRFLFENVDNVSNWGDILQMAVLELIRKVSTQLCASGPYPPWVLHCQLR